MLALLEVAILIIWLIGTILFVASGGIEGIIAAGIWTVLIWALLWWLVYYIEPQLYAYVGYLIT